MQSYIPFMLTNSHFNLDETLSLVKNAGASRIFLALPPLKKEALSDDALWEKLARAVSFFRNEGVEVGVWYWALKVVGKNDFTPLRGFLGKESAVEKCPLDPNFLDFAESVARKVASLHPDILLYDDDLRFGTHDSGEGCLCRYHRAAIEKRLGKTLPDKNLFETMFAGKPNEYRSAYLYAAGESLKNFCKKMRAAVDSVDPTVRIGICSCISVWDNDGVDSYTLAKLLAGGTKPLVRLIGAPYWAENRFLDNRLEDIIELERMERSWKDDKDDIEVFAEGDTYPRPRYRVPSSYLEIFDTALRADGHFDGILKYMRDYNASSAYEPEYLRRHAENKVYSEALSVDFGDKEAVGIRVYEALHKLEQADFTSIDPTPEVIGKLLFSHAARLLANNSIPTTYRGTGICGIVFGENARHLPDEAFSKPLILDIRAAKILSEKGKDVGLVSCGALLTSTTEFFPPFDGETVGLNPIGPFAAPTELCDKATVQSFFLLPDGARIPSCYTYENRDGGRYIVYCFDASRAPEGVMRQYIRPRQLAQLLRERDCPLPIECFGNPDLYILCKSDDKSTAVGFWNCHADFVRNAAVRLDGRYSKARFVNLSGTLDGELLKIDRIGAYEYGYVLLAR